MVRGLKFLKDDLSIIHRGMGQNNESLCIFEKHGLDYAARDIGYGCRDGLYSFHLPIRYKEDRS